MELYKIFVLIALITNSCDNNSMSGNRSSNKAMEVPAQDRNPVPVYLGDLAIRKFDGFPDQLLYDGRPLQPAITGNSGLSIEHTYRYPTKALYVVQDTGGTACPAQFYVVEVTAAGASATSAFGTCSDLVKVAQTPGGLSLTMPGFIGSFDDDADARRAADATHVFQYQNGRITEQKSRQVTSSVRITPAWLAGYWVSAPRATVSLECGTDTGVRFNRDGTFSDGGHTGRFRTSDRAVTYYDRISVDEATGETSRDDFDTPQTTSIRADGANAFIEEGNRYQRCGARRR